MSVQVRSCSYAGIQVHVLKWQLLLMCGRLHFVLLFPKQCAKPAAAFAPYSGELGDSGGGGSFVNWTAYEWVSVRL